LIFSHLLATQPHAPPSRRRPLRTALADRPVVLLHGARQTGKTTLVRAVAEDSGARYVTLDDLTMLSAARSDPAGFLAGFAQPLVLDEVQRAPDLLLAIKTAVDRKRTPGPIPAHGFGERAAAAADGGVACSTLP
jgi:predicted AAA+ superfamily ATPase